MPKTSSGKKKRAPAPSRLNLVNLENGLIEQADVAHTFGFVDLYRDFDKSQPEQHSLEKRLSRLESEAGEIVARIKRLHESGKEEVQLSRSEKDLLRRFLFIMLYRNRSFGARFEKSTEDYDAPDREEMVAYIKAKGFARPRDVWFSNLRAFMDVNLNREWVEWARDLQNEAFPRDAMWFTKNIQSSFMVFCTPDDAANEFLLTQNAYSIFEGPNDAGAWTDYHVFAPVSPRLMILTRSLLLPCGTVNDEDSRLAMLQHIQAMHVNPSSAGSCLEDLPVAIARNNYSKVVGQRVVPLPTNISRDKHVFYFRFFPIEVKHVQTINTTMLEEALGTMAIVFHSRDALRLTLELYLANDSPGFKTIFRHNMPDLGSAFREFHALDDLLKTRSEDVRVPYLRLLERIARELGSTVSAQYVVTDVNVGMAARGMTARGKNRADDFGIPDGSIYCRLGKYLTCLMNSYC